MSETLKEGSDVRTVVREKYGAIAQGTKVGAGGCCGSDCGCGTSDGLVALGYTTEQAAAVPDGADLGLGCGNPLQHAAVQPGETILDLGSGAGIDCFLAARETGPTGCVIGVDMTPAMIEKARANLSKCGLGNVEFRLGEIENLPVKDAAIDLVISNCVVNLSPDKTQVFREALRVLKPGGRLIVSDLVLTRELTAAQRNDVQLYVGCVAGASLEREYLGMMRDAGFVDVDVVSRTAYTFAYDGTSAGSPERQAFESVVSVKVRARKRA